MASPVGFAFISQDLLKKLISWNLSLIETSTKNDELED